jgi:hypothetical protein
VFSQVPSPPDYPVCRGPPVREQRRLCGVLPALPCWELATLHSTQLVRGPAAVAVSIES